MKYSGRLAKPIVRKRLGLLSDESTYTAEANRIAEEMFSKLPDLLEAHGLKDGQWLLLAVELAKAHVPGFQVRISAGRKTEWTKFDKAELRLDVDTIIEQTGLSVVEGIKRAIRLDAWAKKTAPMKIGAIERHYYDADKRLIQIVKKARAYESIVRPN